MPAWVRNRVDQDAVKNQVRLRGITETYRNLSNWLSGDSLDFVFLKGMTHGGAFGLPAESRIQYDIDLWLPRDHAFVLSAC